MAQQVDDLAGRHLLGVEQVVDAHVDEHLLVVGFEVFVVVDAGDGFPRTELLGQHRRHDVVVLLVVDGDEQVAFAHRSLAQHGEGRRVALDGDHVGQTAHLGEQLLVAVDDGDVVAVAAEHTGQVTAHLAGTRYHDFHSCVCLVSTIRRPEGPGNIFAIYLTNVYICPRNPKFRVVKKRNPMPTWLILLLCAILAVGLFVLGMSLTLMIKGHNIDSEISTNKNMQRLGIRCAVQESREDSGQTDCADAGCSGNCSACDIEQTTKKEE